MDAIEPKGHTIDFSTKHRLFKTRNYLSPSKRNRINPPQFLPFTIKNLTKMVDIKIFLLVGGILR